MHYSEMRNYRVLVRPPPTGLEVSSELSAVSSSGSSSLKITNPVLKRHTYPRTTIRQGCMFNKGTFPLFGLFAFVLLMEFLSFFFFFFAFCCHVQVGVFCFAKQLNRKFLTGLWMLVIGFNKLLISYYLVVCVPLQYIFILGLFGHIFCRFLWSQLWFKL